DAPDMVHLQSFRPDGGSGRKAQPVLPGTSVAGALRGRAGLIVRTLGADDERAADLINGMFGPDRVAAGHDAHASRLEIREAVLHGGRSLVQSRVIIDRFTGGAYEFALFDEQQYFGTADSRVDIHLRLRLLKGAGTKS